VAAVVIGGSGRDGRQCEKFDALQEKTRKEWCERGESNPHGLPRQILSLVRLPVPPLSHELSYGSQINPVVVITV
jgi:hypothetical protein